MSCRLKGRALKAVRGRSVSEAAELSEPREAECERLDCERWNSSNLVGGGRCTRGTPRSPADCSTRRLSGCAVNLGIAAISSISRCSVLLTAVGPRALARALVLRSKDIERV